MSWSFVGSVFNQGSTFAINLMVANVLGREAFGRYSIILTTIVVSLQLAQMATGYTATKYVAEYRVANPVRASRILSLCAVSAVVMACLAAACLAVVATELATRVLHVPSLASGLRWGAAIVACGVTSGFLTGALNGLEEYRSLGICNVLSGLLYLAACSAGALTLGFAGAIGGLLIAYGGQTLLLAWALLRALKKHGLQLTMRALSTELDVVLKFALPAAIAGLGALPALWLANAAIVRTSNGLAQVAVYAAATNIKIAAMFLPNVVNGVGLAILNNECGHGTAQSYRAAFWTNWMSVVGLAAAMAGTLVLVAPYALRLFGRSFVGGALCVDLLLAGAVLEGASLATCQILQNRERLWLALATYSLPRDVTLVVVAFTLAPRYGASGVAIGYLIAQAVSLSLVTIAVSIVGFQPRGGKVE